MNPAYGNSTHASPAPLAHAHLKSGPQYPARPRLPRRALPWLLLGYSLGCAQVFGLRDAVCDPKVDPACGNPAQTTLPENTDKETDAGGKGEQGPPSAVASEVISSAASALTASPNVTSSLGLPSSLPPTPSPCDEYCTLMEDACGDKPVRQYATKKQNCIDFCEQTFGANVDLNPKGNTLACRMDQAQLAKDTGGGEGCPEAGPTGGSVCGDPCENYCSGLRQLCPEEADLLGESCVEQCRELPLAGNTFVHPAKPGFTFECRTYHLQLTVTDKPTHCQHAIGLGVPGNQPCAAPKP